MNIALKIKHIYDKIYILVRKRFYKLIYLKNLKLGSNLSFRKNFIIVLELNGNLSIGHNCFFNNGCSINCLGKIDIGDNCLFGENVKLYDHNHKFNNKNKTIIEQGFKIGTIKIGNNCWIGSNVTILKDVQIGNNVIIGSNCLIYKSIPDNSIVKSNNNLIIEKNF